MPDVERINTKERWAKNRGGGSALLRPSTFKHWAYLLRSNWFNMVILQFRGRFELWYRPTS